MKNDLRRNLRWLIVCVLVIAFSAMMVYGIERDFGKVQVQYIKMLDSNGDIIAAKLFKPVAASPENKMPAVLNMHGYQNDKDVQDTFDIEFARRGFIVMAPDSVGHGDSGGRLDIDNFFVDPAELNGNDAAFNYLKNLPFVDADNIGIMGHSMGGMTTVKMPALFPGEIKAIVQVCSLPGSPDLPNLLVDQARYDEFIFFREMQPRAENLNSSPTRLEALGMTEPVEWEKIYGDFNDGTARKMTLVNNDHHLNPLTNKAVAETVDWMRLALKGGVKDANWIEPTKQVFMWKEIFGLITLLGTIVSLFPLTNILLGTKYFKSVAQPLPSRYVPSKGTWWKIATINALIGGLLYPLTTQYGGIGSKKLGTIIPFMKLEVANGVTVFYLANAIVCAILFYLWYRKANKKGVTMYDMGASFDKEKTKIDWGIIGKTVFMAFILFAWMYILEGLSQWALGVEFRFAWPYMRQFSSTLRVGYFFLYLIPALIFFLINGGLFLFGQARLKEEETPAKTQLTWWLKSLYAMVLGLLLVWAFQYLPWILLGMGPGFENVGLMEFSGLWPLMLIVYIPGYVVYYYVLTWFYRKTGRIYLGAIIVASLVTWFLAAGSIIAK